ncbi:MAG: hypothetical protein ABI557_19210 [Aureliella sp.]
MDASTSPARYTSVIRRSVHWTQLAICGLLLSCVCGCATWKREKPNSAPDTSSLLPTRQLNPDSVVIETVLVRFPAESIADLEQQVWHLSNEASADIALRQRLDQNGLRAGVIMGEFPPLIRQQLDQTAEKQKTDALEHAGLAADVDNRMRRLQCRAGRRKDLLVKPELPDPLTVLSVRDGKRVSGDTFDRATVLFDLRVLPHGDGSATVNLTPEIQHGDQRQTFVYSDFGTRPAMRRSTQNWNELKLSAKLTPGQVLIVSSTSPAKALGSTFFVSNTAEQTEERVLLLVRLAESQLDDLFAPEVVQQAQAMAER